MKFEYWFLAAFAILLGNMAWSYFRKGSVTGAMLGGTISREVGHVTLESSPTSKIVQVHVMDSSNSGTFIALTLVSKSTFGASMTPIKLSKPQAAELITLLKEAAE